MDAYFKILIIVCPLVFLAAFIDAIAGGGGIISIPAYLLAGLPVHNAYGCNKFSSTISQIVAVYKYGKAGHIRYRTAAAAAVTSLIGAWVGTRAVLRIDEAVLKVALMCVLPVVAIFLVTRKSFTQQAAEPKELSPLKQVLYPAIIGLACGVYDGSFGPGTGTFLILGFTAVLGYDLITSSGCAKLINLASNVGSVSAHFFGGTILYNIAIPAAIASSLGGYLGSRSAIKGGAKFIRPVIFLVLTMLFCRIIYDFFLA